MAALSDIQYLQLAREAERARRQREVDEAQSRFVPLPELMRELGIADEFAMCHDLRDTHDLNSVLPEPDLRLERLRRGEHAPRAAPTDALAPGSHATRRNSDSSSESDSDNHAPARPRPPRPARIGKQPRRPLHRQCGVSFAPMQRVCVRLADGGIRVSCVFA